MLLGEFRYGYKLVQYNICEVSIYHSVIYDRMHVSIACEYKKTRTIILNTIVIEYIHVCKISFPNKNNM